MRPPAERQWKTAGAGKTRQAKDGSAERLRDQELERVLRQLRGGADAEQLLGQLARNLTNKLLHDPSVQLRRAAAEGRSEMLDWSRRLFGLDETPGEGEREP